MNFEGQAALITGAGRGIGKTIALKLAVSGADTILVDMSPEMDDVRKEIEGMNRKCLTFQVDVTDLEAIYAMVNNIIGELGEIHILVNNAGITQDNLFMRMNRSSGQK